MATEIPVNAAPEFVPRPLILVAEDEAIIAIELADSLQASGFDVAGPFATGAQAEDWLNTAEADAAILDNLLKDGPCDALMADLSRRGVPMVIFSGQDPPAEMSVAHQAAWVTKPVAFPALLDTLRREMHGVRMSSAQD